MSKEQIHSLVQSKEKWIQKHPNEPENLDEADKDSEKAKMMSVWMENYLDALGEMEETIGEWYVR